MGFNSVFKGLNNQGVLHEGQWKDALFTFHTNTLHRVQYRCCLWPAPCYITWGLFVASRKFIEFPLPNKLAQTGTFLTSIRNVSGSNPDHPEVRPGFPLSTKQTLG